MGGEPSVAADSHHVGNYYYRDNFKYNIRMNSTQAIASIRQRFGKEAIVGEKADVEFVHSGSIALDIALGGGVPKGRIRPVCEQEKRPEEKRDVPAEPAPQ